MPVASIREHTRSDGSRSFYVLWRDRDTGKQTSMPEPTRQRAETIRDLLNANDQRLSLVERAIEAGKESTFTVARLLDWHVSMPLEANPDTITKYKQIIDSHLRTQIGSIRASELSDVDLAAWADERVGQGKSRKTLLNATGILAAAYKRAVMRGRLSSNPMTGFRLPSDERAPRRATFLTKDEYQAIRAHLPERYHLFADLLVETGLRFSEATALTDSEADLDFGAGMNIIHVTKAWKGKSGVGWRVGPPKSAESVRDVAITDDLAERLRKHAKSAKGGYIFRNLSGNPLLNADFHQSGWQKAVDAAVEENGLTKNPRPHDLRHTHGSWLLAEGVPMFVVSRRLGHSSIDITTKVYGHQTNQGHKEALAGLERALGH
jgi:integrase